MARPDFTPAPWSLGTVAVVIDGGYYQAPDEAIIYCGPEAQQDENEIRIEGPDALANARLIAAAPELYEALVDLHAAVHGGGFPHEAVKRAEAALSKARGEQP